MTKTELIQLLATRHSLRKSDLKAIVEDTFELISKSLVDGETVRIVGFGAFEVRRRIAREGRNPRTGEKIRLKATRTPSFLPGNTLKKAVKGKK